MFQGNTHNPRGKRTRIIGVALVAGAITMFGIGGLGSPQSASAAAADYIPNGCKGKSDPNATYQSYTRGVQPCNQWGEFNTRVGSAPAPAAPAAPPPAAQKPAGEAKVNNSHGELNANAQRLANDVNANVQGVDSIGGTRASARDPKGHPSGNAVDFMVGDDKAAGDRVVEHIRPRWEDLQVEYLIWDQKILQDGNGEWKAMADRGSDTQNHKDHVHVNTKP